MQWRVTYKGKAYAKEAFSSPNQLNLSVVLCLLPNDAMQKISLPSLGLLGQSRYKYNQQDQLMQQSIVK